MSVILLFVVIAALVGVGIATLGPIITRHFAGAADGWGALAEAYATSKDTPAGAWTAQTLVVGRILYRNCVTVGAEDAGLYMRLGFPLTLLRRPALLIPWSEFKRLDKGRLYWQESSLLSLGEPEVGTLTVPAALFAKIRPHIKVAAA
jgi:hypothetical protein